jgi:hypothetical protein
MICAINLLIITAAERGNADPIQQEKSAKSAGGKAFLFNGVRQAGLSARVG